MKKAVITGATGFLGYVLLKELINNEVYVYVLIRKNSKRKSRLDGLKNIEIIEVTKLCEELDCRIDDADVFYHLAWEGERNNFEEQYINVDITVNCLKLASALGCKRFVCTGSQAEYGLTNELITEETPLNPTTAYGACKVAAYYLAQDYAKRLNIELTWARVFSVYGSNDNPHTLISTLTVDLQSGKVIKLQTDGEHIWNYLHEEDVARALRLLGICNESNTVYNVASSESRPLKDYVGILRGKINQEATIKYSDKKSSVNLNVKPDKLIKDIKNFERLSF